MSSPLYTISPNIYGQSEKSIYHIICILYISYYRLDRKGGFKWAIIIETHTQGLDHQGVEDVDEEDVEDVEDHIHHTHIHHIRTLNSKNMRTSIIKQKYLKFINKLREMRLPLY